MSMTLDDLEVL